MDRTIDLTAKSILKLNTFLTVMSNITTKLMTTYSNFKQLKMDLTRSVSKSVKSLDSWKGLV